MTKLFANNTTMVLILAAVIVIVSILLLNHAFQSTMDAIEWHEQTYQVKDGDTLWAISGKYCPDSVDRREWIDEIRALNHLSGSTVHEGQHLIVLVPIR